MVSVLLSDIVTLEERGLWQGYVNMVFACGAGLGAPLGKPSVPRHSFLVTDIAIAGGIMADTINWRW